MAALAALPGAYAGLADYLGLPSVALTPVVAAVVFGAAIIGAAFLLSWAAEAAQSEVSAGVALAFLAFLAVLPEYAVDFVFTWRAGETFAAEGHCAPVAGEDPCALALANMTGANRVLVGIGWPLVVLIAALVARRHPRRADREPSVPAPGHVRLARPMSIEVVALGVATVYSLTLPLRHSLTLVDAAVLVSIFVLYAWRLSQAPVEEPDLIGTAAWIADRGRRARRWWLAGLFAVAAAVILVTAEHFADSVVGTGEQLGIDRFLLVQWAAPVASEAPELIVACLYAWRLRASHALGTLLSSKVNQWTLLVGTIPIVFAISSGSPHGLPLSGHQRYELLITAAQSLFAVSLLLDLRLTLWGSAVLIGLFGAQFTASLTLSDAANRTVLIVLSAVYLALAAIMMVVSRRRAVRLFREGTVARLDQVPEWDPEGAGQRG
ncbi:sodium:proton exchanger [Catenuloplanes atrovinosus]|uniref:Cation:H+ antiporter n=1 Tax=Catenuloplanes atrovinosus TaxID=137266 RepID=A0AAE4CCH0_9ACTN|nr:sodium:proton exchanger [Catenuloplanes atrovinosus]MDR7276510.1 cation:H+ antiporter [Catenuloplanes atrovinosus]